MPGFNRRGPQGEGPMTGRGRGDCIVDATDVGLGPEDRGVRIGLGRFGAGLGAGRGAGRGTGRGLFLRRRGAGGRGRGGRGGHL